MKKYKRSTEKAVSMQTMVFIGKKLKDLRLRRAMSQRKLAETAGMSQRPLLTSKPTEESLAPLLWGSSQTHWASSPQSSSKTRLYAP